MRCEFEKLQILIGIIESFVQLCDKNLVIITLFYTDYNAKSYKHYEKKIDASNNKFYFVIYICKKLNV